MQVINKGEYLQLARPLLIFILTKLKRTKGFQNEQGAVNEQGRRCKNNMAKDVIRVDGEEKVVREDTAKSYRGVIWALTSVGLIILIAVILFFAFGIGSAVSDKKVESPGQIENSTRR